jgi:uncharacterized protein (DUF4415 family)
MKAEYDFSGARRGPVRKLPPKAQRSAHTKVRITIMLDQDVLDAFRARAHAPGALPYQSQINAALRTFLAGETSEDRLLSDDRFLTKLADRVSEVQSRKRPRKARKASG